MPRSTTPAAAVAARPDRITRRRAVAALAVAAASAAVTAPAFAQTPPWPTRGPITLVVPHASGGAVDSVARTYAELLQGELKQSVVVENRPGASGIIGAGTVARAPADGYTLYLNASIHNINPLLYKSTVKFDAVKDFTAISMLAQGALILSVNPAVDASTVADLVRVVKAKPDAYSFATSGFGSAGHLGIAQFMYESGLSDLKVPIILYKGAGPALADLMGGSVHAMMDPMLSSMPLVKSGKLRALAVTGRVRSPLLPDVPTMKEAGLKDFEMYSWYGLWSPAALPEPILKRLEAASAKITSSPEMTNRLGTFGFETAYKNSSDFGKFIQVETTRYQGIIDKAHITVE